MTAGTRNVTRMSRGEAGERVCSARVPLLALRPLDGAAALLYVLAGACARSPSSEKSRERATEGGPPTTAPAEWKVVRPDGHGRSADEVSAFTLGTGVYTMTVATQPGGFQQVDFIVLRSKESVCVFETDRESAGKGRIVGNEVRMRIVDSTLDERYIGHLTSNGVIRGTMTDVKYDKNLSQRFTLEPTSPPSPLSVGEEPGLRIEVYTLTVEKLSLETESDSIELDGGTEECLMLRRKGRLFLFEQLGECTNVRLDGDQFSMTVPKVLTSVEADAFKGFDFLQFRGRLVARGRVEGSVTARLLDGGPEVTGTARLQRLRSY